MSLLDGHMSWDILFVIFNIPDRPLCLSQFECAHVIYAIKGTLTFFDKQCPLFGCLDWDIFGLSISSITLYKNICTYC